MTDDERKAYNRERQARWRATNKDRSLAQGRASRKKWYAAHRDEARAINKAYHAAHRSEQLALRRSKRQANLESARADGRARWAREKTRNSQLRKLRRDANPEEARRKANEYRAARPELRARAVARTAEWNRKNPERSRALLRKQDAKRRAIEKQVFVEAVDHRTVFERDKGICGICQQEVDVTSPWEVDHIVPILRGGLHAYANVQLAHRRCNRSKGARVA